MVHAFKWWSESNLTSSLFTSIQKFFHFPYLGDSLRRRRISVSALSFTPFREPLLFPSVFLSSRVLHVWWTKTHQWSFARTAIINFPMLKPSPTFNTVPLIYTLPPDWRIQETEMRMFEPGNRSNQQHSTDSLYWPYQAHVTHMNLTA